LGLREAQFIDTLNPQPDNRFIVRGYSIIEKRNESKPPRSGISIIPSPRGLESIRVHDLYLSLFFIDPSLADTPGPQNRNRRGTVIIFNPYENDRVQLLQKSNAYGGAFVYTIDKWRALSKTMLAVDK
jgi:hypothetical protein